MNHKNIKQINDAEKIYDAIFKRKIPPSLSKSFFEASEKLELRYSKDEINRYHKYMEKVKDLEALEYACRWFKRCPLLIDKFKIMVFLAETLPENHHAFVNENIRPIFNWLLMGKTCLHSAWKLVKGIFLLKAHSININTNDS
jgi:hypothetical protein